MPKKKERRKEKPILFCNVGWMERYDGIAGDLIQRGGAYNKKHEVCNFSNVDTKVYGYVQPPGRLDISRLGVGKNDEYAEGVTVIWLAGPDSGGTAIVGWYKNATVYCDMQPIKKPTRLQNKNGIKSYLISTSTSDATLLPVNKRDFIVPMGRATSGTPECSKLVARVRRLVNSGGDIDRLPDVDAEAKIFEGNPQLVAHFKRERNASIIKKKKKDVLARSGVLGCEVCGFDFAKFYGKHGREFCEVHHLTPLHESDGSVATELSDLSVVCSNCHRIIHHMDPMPSIQALAKVVRANSKLK